MRKKLLGGLLVVAIAAVAAFNVNMNTENNELSSLTLANVEALALTEYEIKQWNIYHRPDGTGYNCSKGGSESC